jgi:dipeptidyl aminopeptidase/acylaminoacyl peptidase
VALMTAIEHPGTLRCVISIAGVTDPREVPGGDLVNALPDGGSAVMAPASPIRRAGEIDVPVLMFHGSRDVEFDATAHTLVFATVLERAGKDVIAIEYPQSMHEIRRHPDRIDMLARMRGFLAEQIGPPLTGEESAIADRWRP